VDAVEAVAHMSGSRAPLKGAQSGHRGRNHGTAVVCRL